MSEQAFHAQTYHDAQMAAFADRLGQGSHQIIEFGGKPFGDHHAARVLPGYDPDIKARILKELTVSLDDVSIAMSLHAQDVLHAPNGRRISQRIRGDSGLHYDEEVVRLARQAHDEFDLPVDTVVLTALPEVLSPENQDYIEEYSQSLAAEGLAVRSIRALSGYPFLDVGLVREALTQAQPITDSQNLIVVSPGGGSGKFGVALTQVAHLLEAGHNPNFVKFETFPVFKLPIEHPLNTAFLAATADLPNILIETSTGKTNYDKDVENLALLKTLLSHYPSLDSPLHDFIEPTDMGVNVIESGIVDHEAVVKACMVEITRRLMRYKSEHQRGEESVETIERVQGYIDQDDSGTPRT